MIIINFKNYVFGKKSLDLAKKIERYLPRAIVCPATVDVEEIASKTRLKVFGQHVSSKKGRRATGFVVAEEIKKAGGKGSLLNHSEHRISEREIKGSMQLAEKNKLKIVLCVKSVSEARNYKKFKPWAMAYEDAKLVGSGKSITDYRQEDVRKFVWELKRTKIIPICGAGVSTVGDVKAARKLGCKGVLIASAVANSKNPGKLLGEISKV